MNITTVSDTLAINRPRLRPRIGTASDSRMDEWDERERESTNDKTRRTLENEKLFESFESWPEIGRNV